MTLPDRFWRKVERTDGCWLWLASTTAKGYGQVRWDGTMMYAHRLAYEALVGEIPQGLQLDHLCRVRRCVNPAHLEPVTCAENLRRGDRSHYGAWQRSRQECPKGHPYSGDNLYRNGTNRQCQTCRREAERRYRARKCAEAGA